MNILIPEKERVPGVCYALTAQGVELPVIDVTHPSFALDGSTEAMKRLRERTAAEAAQWQRKPRWLRRLLYLALARRSVLLQGMRSSHGTFLSGMNTYLLKLGPMHLASSFAQKMDRRIAGKAASMDVRYRLQIMAELLADRIAAGLSAAPAGRALTLLNIAGGPAMDGLNALILARQRAPESLAGRKVRIAVLDLQEEAPAFGRNALAALRANGAPLAGVDATFEHFTYDWNQPETLRQHFAEGGDALVLGSSEGGLFHYGDDATIHANLEALRACSAPDFRFAGSLGIDTPENRAAMALTGAAVRYFRPEVFEALAQGAGWRIERQARTLRSLCVRLAKA